MKTITINAYQYDELSDKAKEQVYKDYLNNGVDDWWYESTYFDADQFYLDIEGFDVYINHIEIKFKGVAEDTAKAIVDGAGGELLELAKDWAKEVNDLFKSYSDYDNYMHWLKEQECDEEDYDFEDWVLYESGYEDDKESADADFLKQLGEYYLNYLKSDYDHFTSEEYVADLCECNDWYFDINGKILNNE
jgi:hypothetical protein